MKRLNCRGCGRALRNVEVALNLKLRGRATGVFLCEECLAKSLNGTPAELREMARFFTENGCELFSGHYVDGE